MSARQQVVVLGSTGSVGTSALDVVASHSDRFQVLGLAAGNNITLLQEQIDRFTPRFVVCRDHRCSGATQIDSDDALTVMATLPDADIVVVATTGHAAIVPTIEALRAGKIVALANKEAIVAAGEIVMEVARSSSGSLRPVDSEHSAIWQCLEGLADGGDQVRRLILTASGGPFRGWSRADMTAITPEMALKHPNWTMGSKITIDSATLMNKGLETLEARWLFDRPLDQIDVLVHPQSIVHSMVEFVDGGIIAQLGTPDMRLPIQYALTYPERLSGQTSRLSLADLAKLEFVEPDNEAFPLLNISRKAGRRGSTYPTVLSAADDVAVAAFLAGRIGFLEIADVIEATLDAHVPASGPLSLDGLSEADAWAQRYADGLVRGKPG